MEYFAQYSAAAYCTNNNNSTDTKVTCPQGHCGRVEAADTKTVTEFENSIVTDVTGFVAVDSTHELIVLSFRGSRSVRNWVNNLDFLVGPTSLCPDCSVGKGYWKSWLEAESNVMDAIARARKEHPTYRVIATGHSLGGALAALAAAVLRSQGCHVDLYTYGAPKLGYDAVSKFLESNEHGNTYRVTHKYDLVPKVTPAILGFRHISPEYYITTNNQGQPSVNDVKVLTGSLNLGGNEGDFGLSIPSHLFYFVPMAKCVMPAFEWKS